MRKMEDFMAHVAGLDFVPGTVIDAGVAWGTPEIYDAFPEAYFVLIEALPVFEPTLKNILKKRRGEYHVRAVSNFEGKDRFRLDASAISKAGFSINAVNGKGELEQDVEITTLDKLLAGRELEGPILLKTDLQGHDLLALRGGLSLLPQCGMVVMEMSMFNDENLLTNAIVLMREHGFELYDVFGQMARPYDGAIAQCDAAFVPADSPLRAYRRWA